MKITDEMVRSAALAMYGMTPVLSMSGASDLARAALEAALTEDGVEWEYSIAFREDDGWWNTDGVDTFESEGAAREDLERGGYLDSDHVVRRRAAGPWEPVSP